MESLKGQVIRLFLEFVSRFVPIGEGQFATLGGRGVEARIWQELGIPHNHGWLIERNRERGKRLISNHRYRTQNQLGTFDQILAGHGDTRAFVDAFHLDLCGTLSNSAIANFAPALPLVLKSRGRCLAITVADARRNPVLEQWPDFKKRALKMFGKDASSIYGAILERQRHIPVNKSIPTFIKPFDPEKATRRELGLLVELTELLQNQELPWVPITMERYVYVSRYQNRPFRMRTYFFRFETRFSKSPEVDFARAWIESKLFFANGEEFQEIKPAVGTMITVRKINRGERLMSISKLSELARVLGGAEQAEYSELLDKSRRLDAFLAALEGAGVAGIENNRTATSFPAKESTGRQPRRVKRNWDDLSDREKIEFQLEALELKALLNGNWESGKERQALIKKTFGHYSKDLSGSVRGSLARTNGGFREMFKTRIEKVFGIEAGPYLDRLAKV